MSHLREPPTSPLQALLSDPTQAMPMLNPQESALIRGFAQGLPLERLAAYYLNHERPGKVLRVLNGLRESLRDRAEKHARPDLAEVFGTSVRNWPRHGTAMLAALDQIECLGEPRPTLTDSPQRWLPARLACKLPSARFPDFDALYQAMEADGYFWWRGIPGLGAMKARAITAWLTARETVLGRQVPKTAQEKPKRPRVPVWARARAASTVSTDDRTNALLPLERFVYPAMSQELDGRTGTNRAPSGKMIDAEDDLAALRTWLALRPEGGHTHRSYRKEAERFLLWAVVQRGKALSSLNAEDATAYRDFLSALDPASSLPWSGALPRTAWLGPRQTAHGSLEWRPFAGPLSPRSQAQALTIVGSLCEWLVDVGYLLRNPFRGVPARVATPAGVKIQRAFNTALWRYLLDSLDKPPGERARRAWRRNRFLLYLGYGTGLRLAEITEAKLGDLKRMAGEGLGDSFWVLEVRGKGQRLREVPLVETVARELRAYLAARALPEDLQGIDRELPLIERLREDPFEAPRSGAPKTTLATSSVSRSLKRFFAACATALEAEGYPHAAVRLRSASTHWLRHTHGTLALKAEIPLTTVRDSLGHANLSTSGIYLHEDLVERKRQMERLFEDPAGDPKSPSASAP